MIDTHCHIDRFPRPDLIAKEAEQKGITTIGVTNLPSHYRTAREHLAGYKHVFPALGLHPLASDAHERELRQFLALAPAVEYIGEIGLDFSREGYATKERQLQSFRAILRTLANAPRKLITLHSRQAEEETFSLLTEFGVGPVIFHWYTGRPDTLAKLLAAGHYVSVNPAMINSPKWQAMFAEIPRDKVLTETDAPFVEVNGKPAKPASVTAVLGWLAATWRITSAQAESIVASNYQTMVGKGSSQETEKIVR